MTANPQPPGFDLPLAPAELRYLLIALVAGALLWPLHTLQPARTTAPGDEPLPTTVSVVVERDEREPPLPAFAGDSERADRD